MTTLFRKGLIGMVLACTTALPAMSKDISWIYCGDAIDPVHEKAIKDWDAKNPDFKKVYEAMSAFRGDEYLWFQIAEYTFDNFLIRSRVSNQL